MKIKSTKNKNQGVYTTTKKDGSTYYRSSITCRNKHISLASYDTKIKANKAYNLANKIFNDPSITIDDYDSDSILSFKKWVVLINYRDNNVYFSTPIYLKTKFFYYHLSPTIRITFDKDDLFYYSAKTIMKRGNHLFVADYGMQYNIINRYGIRSYSVVGRDYIHINNDIYDYRYENIDIINNYYGVQKISKKNKDIYKAIIHVNGNYIIGYYKTPIEAAIAYNKAIDILKQKGSTKKYNLNYIEKITNQEYAKIYSEIVISSRLYTIVF